MTVLTLHVAAPTFLNSRASDAYRNSIQGLYAMVVAGASRIVGGVVAGWFAQRGLPLAFGWGAALCGAAIVLLLVAFHEKKAVAHDEPREFAVVEK